MQLPFPSPMHAHRHTELMCIPTYEATSAKCKVKSGSRARPLLPRNHAPTHQMLGIELVRGGPRGGARLRMRTYTFHTSFLATAFKIWQLGSIMGCIFSKLSWRSLNMYQ